MSLVKWTTEEDLNSVSDWNVYCYQNRSYEDRHIVARIGPISYYAVFDGHGSGNDIGDKLKRNHVILYLRDHLHYELAHAFTGISIDDIDRICNRIIKTFKKVDKYLYKIGGRAGCTCNIVMIFSKYILQINLGDSRSILFKDDGTIVSATQDHKPDDELERIEQAGGYVQGRRVNGILALSRAFGDFKLKLIDGKYSHEGPVSVIPDIIVTKRQEPLHFVIGTDGLFDGVDTNEDVVKMLLENDLNCTPLGEHARIDNGNDDITIISGYIH